MISYKTVTYVKVYNDKKYVGKIVKLSDGRFQYWPEGRRDLAEKRGIRDSVGAVQRLLEGK